VSRSARALLSARSWYAARAEERLWANSSISPRRAGTQRAPGGVDQRRGGAEGGASTWIDAPAAATRPSSAEFYLAFRSISSFGGHAPASGEAHITAGPCSQCRTTATLPSPRAPATAPSRGPLWPKPTHQRPFHQPPPRSLTRTGRISPRIIRDGFQNRTTTWVLIQATNRMWCAAAPFIHLEDGGRRSIGS